MEIHKKIFKVKQEIGKISKDSKNPFYNSKYFDVNALLEHVEPLLQKNGLLLLQPIKDGIVYTIIFDTETGESIESGLHLKELNDPQKTGSEITYYRRYTLQSLLGLQAEDDDGNHASSPRTQNKNTESPSEWLNVGTPAWNKAVKNKMPLKEVRQFYKVSKANAEQYELEIKT